MEIFKIFVFILAITNCICALYLKAEIRNNRKLRKKLKKLKKRVRKLEGKEDNIFVLDEILDEALDEALDKELDEILGKEEPEDMTVTNRIRN